MLPEFPDDESGERELLDRTSGVQDFIRKNFGLYHPPADYKAIRAENLRRTQRAEKKALGDN
jgi:hypothetical protein